MPQERPDEDASRFGIPRIAIDGRRYRFREVVTKETLRRTQRVRDPTKLHQVSRELVFRFLDAPSEHSAAALLETCTLRPDTIVRVAAAAAEMKLTAEPSRLMAILAKATRDSDPLVRDLGATALAQVYPEHRALQR